MKSLVIGGAHGIGLAVALTLAESCEKVIIVDKSEPEVKLPSNVIFDKQNLVENDLLFIYKYIEVDLVFYSAGFGRIGSFETFHLKEIENCFKVNTLIPIQIISIFSRRLLEKKKFYMGVMVSIAGHVVSPLFALYGATKAAVKSEIESVNIELEKNDSPNRILDISPGSIKGTRFNGGSTTLIDSLKPLALTILTSMIEGKTLYIPDYDAVYKAVISQYKDNPHQFGVQSFDYKQKSGRVNNKPRLKIGYLSGTFDLFHIGHLNLLKRAKDKCDYLVVGVHENASHKGKTTFIPFEERKAILRSIKYVDRVIDSEKEDCDVYLKGIVPYDVLFVGSDYKNTPRFNHYEEIFKDLGVEIVYFPYTQGTSSTQLRSALLK